MKKIKQLLSVSALAVATALCAQESGTVPTLEQMEGDFIVMNSRVYNEMTSLAEMKQFTITPVGDDSIRMSGFYTIQGMDFNAEYDKSTGTIYIPAATPILDMESYMFYLYAWNDETEEVIMRPIEYKYTGNDTWVCSTTIMLVAIQDETIQPYYFSEGSQISRCNGTSENVSYSGSAGSQVEYVESRPAYVTIDGDQIDIYNFLQADQYGYGVHITGVYMEDSNEAWFYYTTTGQANDGTYRVLTGCEYDETTNMPTGASYPDTDLMGMIHATVDLEAGEMVFDPMAIWASEYSEDSGLVIDQTLLFEFVKSVKVTYEVPQYSAIEAPVVDEVQKEIEKVELYTVDGKKISEPLDGTFVIKLTVYKDKSTKAEKMIFRRN